MKTAFIRCTVLDGTENMTQKKNTTLVVENGKILSVSCAPAPKDADEVIDLNGKYLMPGLINLHVHLPGSGYPKKKKQDSAKLAKLIMKTRFTRMLARKMCEKYAKTELQSGVTTIRTVGGLGNIDGLIRDKVEKGTLLAPRLVVCNTAISVPGGHMVGSVARAGTTVEECRAFVREEAEKGADWIKLMITGGVLDAVKKGEPGALRMQPEYVRACTDEAHKLGKKVCAHVESPEGVKVALENGVDSIEHGAKPSEETVALFKQTGACHVCTISPAMPIAKFNPELVNADETMQFNGRVVFDGIVDCAKSALENGITVGLGTDTACPFVTHYDMWRELVYFVKYVGVSNSFALHTATQKNAEIAGVGDVTGTVEAGKCADFLITEKNPLDDLKALRTPYMVVARGKVIKSPKVKKNPVCERELDKFLP